LKKVNIDQAFVLTIASGRLMLYLYNLLVPDGLCWGLKISLVCKALIYLSQQILQMNTLKCIYSMLVRLGAITSLEGEGVYIVLTSAFY